MFSSGFGRVFWFGAIAGSLAAATPARAETPPATVQPDPTTALFEIGLDFALVGRRFTYTDPVTVNLRDFLSPGAPMPEIHLGIYPAARTRVPVLRDLGLFFDGAHAFSPSSTTSTGEVIGTSFDRFDVGLRERFRPGPPGLMLGAALSFGVTKFGFDATGTIAEQVPSVTYDTLRIGGDARLPAGPVAVTIALGFDHPVSAGGVAPRFRQATIGGVDASLGVRVPIARGFEGRFDLDYARYFYSFTPARGDAYVAGGALDEFFGARLGANYAY